MATLFKTLSELLEKVESTKKRLEIIEATAQFLKSLEPEELEPAVSMILGRPFPAWSQETLEISWATASSILQRVTTTEWKIFRQTMSNTGDVGEAAKTLFEKSKPIKQSLLVQKQLTILDIRCA